jgi:peptidyl-prolyl cis-trans isomerase SurA
MNILFLTFLSIFFLSLNQTSFAETIDRIVAIVDDEVITMSELNEKLKPIIEKNLLTKPSKQQMQTLYNQILPQIIDEKIAENEIKKRNIKVGDEDVDFAINNILLQNSLTKEQLAERLGMEGITLDDYKKDIKNQILRSKLINFAVKAKVVVSEEEIDNFIKKETGALPEKIEAGEVYILDQISVSIKNNTNPKEIEDSEKKIFAAKEELENGKKFYDVAKTYSDLYNEALPDKGITAGAFKLEEISPAFREQVTQLKSGKTTDIIKTGDGFYIFMLKEKIAGDKKFKNVDNRKRNEVREFLFKEKLNQTFQEWLKELRSKSSIRILL